MTATSMKLAIDVRLRGRVIDKLRKLFTGTWRYDPRGSRWVGETFEVYGVSLNYDESSGYHDVAYQRSDTFERIYELGMRREYCG
jgi:hypothetical protein